MYSAFLIMNISNNLKSFDIDKCNDRFENFYRLHNLEVDRLTAKNNLSSIAIWKREYINRFWHEPYAIVNGYNGIFGSESFIEVH